MLNVGLKFSYGSDSTIWVRQHWQYSGGPPTTANCVSLATSIYNQAVTDFIPILATTNSLTECFVYDLSSATAASGTYALSTVGTFSGGVLPAQTCALQNLTVARRYRGGKPRNYWPFGVGSSLATPQTWSPTMMTSLGANMTLYVNAVKALSAGTVTIIGLGNVSYYEGFTVITDPVTGRVSMKPKPRVGGPLAEPVTGWSFNPRPGSQRRRIAA